VKEHLDDLRAASLAYLRSAGAWIAAHRPWVEWGVLSVVGLIAAYTVGTSAQSAAARYDQQAQRLVAIGAGLDRWASQLQPAEPAESLTWIESEQAVRTIDAEGADPTTIARIVAARAEEAGITDLAMRLLRPDELAPPPPLEVGSWSIETGSSGVAVEFVGDWAAVIGFLGSLPAQVEVGRVSVTPGPDLLLRARVTLLAREVSTS
jgi:hypothetical protein